MNASNYIAVVALAVSVCTFLFGMYQQYFRGPRIRLVVGDALAIGQHEAGYLGVIVDTTLFNRGAREVQVVSLTGTMLSEHSGREVSLRWFCFTESRPIQALGGGISPWTGFATWPTTLIVPGRAGISRSVSLNTDAPVRLTPGNYSVTVRAWGAAQKHKSLASARFRLALDCDDLTALAKGVLRNGSQGSVRYFKRWRGLQGNHEVFRSAPSTILPLVEL